MTTAYQVFVKIYGGGIRVIGIVFETSHEAALRTSRRWYGNHIEMVVPRMQR